MNAVATDIAYSHTLADVYDDMKAKDNYERFAELLMPVLWLPFRAVWCLYRLNESCSPRFRHMRRTNDLAGGP